MPNRPLPSRAADYRARAAEACARALAAQDEATRQTLLRDVDIWERMAKWEDETHPQPVNAHGRLGLQSEGVLVHLFGILDEAAFIRSLGQARRETASPPREIAKRVGLLQKGFL
jgi:hypothetical protein